MNVTINEQEGVATIIVEGRVDTTNAKEFETAVIPVIEGKYTETIIDCAQLSYISSSGLRVFLMMQKGVNAKGGKLKIKNLSQAILEIFTVTGFAAIFTIE